MISLLLIKNDGYTKFKNHDIQFKNNNKVTAKLIFKC